jgi:hypothetical protein
MKYQITDFQKLRESKARGSPRQLKRLNKITFLV